VLSVCVCTRYKRVQENSANQSIRVTEFESSARKFKLAK
jgi:hypothetical protein